MTEAEALTLLLDRCSLATMSAKDEEALLLLVKKAEEIPISIIEKAIDLKLDGFSSLLLKEISQRGDFSYPMRGRGGRRMMEMLFLEGMEASATFLCDTGEPNIPSKDGPWPKEGRVPLIFIGVATRRGGRPMWGFPYDKMGFPYGNYQALVEKTTFLAKSWEKRLREGVESHGLSPDTRYEMDVPNAAWPLSAFWVVFSGLDEKDENLLIASAECLARKTFGEPLYYGVLPETLLEEGVAAFLDKDAAREHRLKKGLAAPHRFAKKQQERKEKFWRKS